MNATITVRFVHAGVHCWPGAPDHRSYLRERHRHLFRIEVSTSVEHDDREIEFHDLIEEASWVLKRRAGSSSVGYGDFETMSCEQIARHIAGELTQRYHRAFTVSVYEDGECGATVSS